MFRLLLFLIILPSLVNAQVITTIAGLGDTAYSGDGGYATACELYYPGNIAFDKSGNLYISDGWNQRIRKIDLTGIITTIAGNGMTGYNGDGILATSAKLNYPNGIAIDDTGNIYICDLNNNRIRKVNISTGIITTIAGTGIAGFSGDSGLAINAEINGAYGIAIDNGNNIYFSDASNRRIRKINTSGIISTVAGNGMIGYSGDGGPAINAKLRAPSYICISTTGEIYIPDWSSHVIRKVNTAGIISTIAGNGIQGNSGDGGIATSAELYVPNSVTLDKLGNIYIADIFNNNVRKIDLLGIITTVAGTGIAGYNGDGILPTIAQLNWPNSVAINDSNQLYIADTKNNRIRKVTFNVGVNNIENVTPIINISPNPATNKISISATNKIESLVITNTTGQVVLIRNNINAEKLEVDIKDLTADLYFVRLNGLYTQKLVKR